MAHKLAELKRIFQINFNGNDPVLEKEGDLDVSGMKENGNLPAGKHTPKGGNPLTITGRAYKHEGIQFFTFSHEGAPGTFVGKLIFDKGGKLIVVGSVSLKDATIAEVPLDQQEGTWIITKP
jgi:hypothetical protein